MLLSITSPRITGLAVIPLAVCPTRRTGFEGDSMYSLAQAAKATGKSKPTIARAIKAGRLSATRADDGSYTIDPAELARVFSLAAHSIDKIADAYPATSPGEVEALTIRQLWNRLDAEVEERRRVQEWLTGLLTHRQARSVPAVQKTETRSAARAAWWQRWFR